MLAKILVILFIILFPTFGGLGLFLIDFDWGISEEFEKIREQEEAEKRNKKKRHKRNKSKERDTDEI